MIPPQNHFGGGIAIETSPSTVESWRRRSFFPRDERQEKDEEEPETRRSQRGGARDEKEPETRRSPRAALAMIRSQRNCIG